MRIFDCRWIGNYGENTLVHDPSIGNSAAKTLIFVGFTVMILISPIM